MLETLIFYMFAIVLVVSSTCVVLSKNPVYAVLFLIFSFFNAGAIFVILGAEFLAMVLVIVYVGAVAVLFLFVVMLINMQTKEQRSVLNKYSIFSVILLLILGIELFIFIYSGISDVKFSEMDSNFSNRTMFVVNLGKILYNDYYYIFIVSSLILTVAMIGAVVIAGKDGLNNNHRQDVFLQNIRSKEQSVITIDVEREKGIK